MTDLAVMARILRAAADECEAIAREQAGERREWLPQSDSPLGPKKHCAAVRRRLEQGLGGAAIVGRRHLLAEDALAEELELTSRRPTKAPTVELEGMALLRERLRLVGGDL